MNAPDKATEIRALVTLVLSFLTALWGWLGWAIAIFIASMAADYVTGTWAARARGTWSSAAARQGLWHKLGEIAALLVAALCDIAVQVVLHSAAAPLVAQVDLPHCLTMIVARRSPHGSKKGSPCCGTRPPAGKRKNRKRV